MRGDNVDITYWQVQAQWVNNKKDQDWFFHTYCGCVNDNKFDMADDHDNIPSACGTCWQKYGIFGVLNEEAGIKWLELVRQEARLQETNSKKRIKLYDHDRYTPVRFRLVKIHIIKETDEVNI